MNQLNHINPSYDRQESSGSRARKDELRSPQTQTRWRVHERTREEQMEEAEEERHAKSSARAGEEALAYDRHYYSR